MFNQYVLILVWLGFMALLQGRFYREEYNELIDDYDWRVTPVFAFMVMLPVIWMAANREYFADTSLYILIYSEMPSTFQQLSEYMNTVTKDAGFSFISVVLKCILGQDYFLYLLILAVFQGVAVAKFFRRYSVNYVLAIFLFVASTDYIAWMFNGLRQFTAVSIILFAAPLMLNKKYFKMIIIILIASTIHQSALLMIPFMFIAGGEAFNKRTILFIVAIIAAVFFVGQFTDFMNETLQYTQYKNVVSDYTGWDDGTNPIRVLVYCVPAIIAAFNARRIRGAQNVLINFSANMSLISAGLYLISMVTSGIFLGRLPIYCSLFGYILLPWEIENLFSYNNSKILKVATIVGYIAFYYYAMHFQNGII